MPHADDHESGRPDPVEEGGVVYAAEKEDDELEDD